MINLLTSNDRTMIKNFISYHSDNEERINLENVLHYWAEEKNQTIRNLFGDELIIKIPVEDNSEVINEIENICYGYHGDKNPIYALRECISYLTNIGGWSSYYEQMDIFYACFNPNRFLTKYIDKDYIFNFKEEKTFKIKKGIRTIKALKSFIDFVVLNIVEDGHAKDHAKIAEETYQEFINAISLCLSKKHDKANLCLSIHPLDYMTASHNNNNWSSCMRWDENEGGYCLGTVEMLNSPDVIVAYLESANNRLTYDNGFDWNSKKWRTFIVVHDTECTINKNYPMTNDSFNNTILSYLKDKTDMKDYSGEAKIYFNQGPMYNDFQENMSNSELIRRTIVKNGAINNISFGTEKINCMCCGKPLDWTYEPRDWVFCEECSPRPYCECDYDEDDY